jgi:hypothetical protein
MILAPFNYAEKVAEGVEMFFSMQRQTLQTAFENLERSRNSQYESLSRTQISFQNATETFGQQILTTQLVVRKFVTQAFQSKLPKPTRQWETLQQNFSNHCEHALNETNYSVAMSKQAMEQSRKAESQTQQLARNFLIV